MRVLIVDDESNARNRLQIMLDELDVEVVGEASNGIEALELVDRLRPDVLLLDINMPEVDGFDVVRHLSEPAPMVVFQTAHDEFAIQAFDHEAVDYLVKPISLTRLQEALARVQRRLNTERAQPIGYPADLIDELRTAIGLDQGSAQGRMLVRDGSGHRLLSLSQIRLFVAREGEVYALASGRDFLTDYTLSELEHRYRLAFVRASRSELVGLAHVDRLFAQGDGVRQVVLVDGTRVRISRRRAAEFRRRLEGLS